MQVRDSLPLVVVQARVQLTVGDGCHVESQLELIQWVK